MMEEEPALAPAPEPVVNFIPIKVEHGRPASPAAPAAAAKAPSRPSSQEYQTKPGKSPTPMEQEPKQQQPRDPKIGKLETIMESVEEIKVKISGFQGSRKDKEYLYLDDLLTKLLIQLDGIDTEGRNEIKQMRKESINNVNKCLSLLDERATETQ